MDFSTPSSSGSRSPSPEPQETIQIFIKSLSGDTFPVTLPSSTPITTLTTLLSLRTNLPPSTLRLVHAGKHLSPSSPPSSSNSHRHASISETSLTTDDSPSLASFNIPPHAVLYLTTPLRGGMPPKKPRCTFKDCRDPAQRIIGDCSFCPGHFCGKHRLLEDHQCEGLEDCKKESFERNREQLERERTVVTKI